jgi:tetratricopeptide (TPR) repeat protein
MLNEKQLKTALALGVFAVAFATYMLTLAPTVTFWDCGELIAASHILGNPHPPGNPLFTTIARAFIVGLPFDEVAMRVNFLSSLNASLAVMVAFLFTHKLLNLIFGGTLSRFTGYAGAGIAAFLITFSDTYWFNSVEAEVYSASMLIVMLVSWLSLHWYENRGTARGKRALVLIAYLAFLGMGIHPFSFITIPVVALFLLFADKDIRTDVPLLLTGAALLSVIYDLGDFVWYALGALLVTGLASLIASSPEWRAKWRFSMALCVVALLGFSSYAYVPIRSMVAPTIDEGEPKTYAAFKEYLERKQYGSESMLRRALHRRGQLQNQVLAHPHMGYGGYMLAQYLPWKQGEVRLDENEVIKRNLLGMDLEFRTLRVLIGEKPGLQLIFFILFQIPFLYGGYLAYKRKKQLGLYILMLYAATSYGLVFYMNFADGTGLELRDYQYWAERNFDPRLKPSPVHLEVRDRDYFFTPGFMYMGILFGIAAAFLLEKLGRVRRSMVMPAGMALLVLAAAVPGWSNYRENNRSGDYVPWDYAYNLLMSCRPNSILFTNGDNDTFPLWFIQEVEGVRKDVRVVNLSLVNTNWYIKQLRSREPALKIGFTDQEIDMMQPRAWEFKQTVAMKLPNSSISVELEPRPYLKVQDIMVLHIVQNNYPARPVHFAVTVSDDNMMGLEKYLLMEGMVYTVVEERKNKEVDAVATARLVDSVYQYRGLGDPKVYIDLNTEGLLTNYSATNFRLVMWAQERIAGLDRRIEELRKAGAGADSVAALEKERAERISFAEKYLELNSRILPREWRNNYYGAQFYAGVGNYAKAEEYYKRGLEEAPNAKLFGSNLGQMYIEQGKYAQAETLLIGLKDQHPGDFELWYGLSDLYQKQGQPAKARAVLSEWLKGNPSHQYAKMVQDQIQFLEAQQAAPSPAPVPAPPPDSPASPRESAVPQAPGAAAPNAPSEGGIPGLAPAGGKPATPAPARGGDTAGKGAAAGAGNG